MSEPLSADDAAARSWKGACTRTVGCVRSASHRGACKVGVVEDEEYEVEAVVAERQRNGQTEYLLKWKGWPEDDNTWEKEATLVDCPDVLAAWRRRAVLPPPVVSHSSSSSRKRPAQAPQPSRAEEAAASSHVAAAAPVEPSSCPPAPAPVEPAAPRHPPPPPPPPLPASTSMPLSIPQSVAPHAAESMPPVLSAQPTPPPPTLPSAAVAAVAPPPLVASSLTEARQMAPPVPARAPASVLSVAFGNSLMRTPPRESPSSRAESKVWQEGQGRASARLWCAAWRWAYVPTSVRTRHRIATWLWCSLGHRSHC